MLKLIKDVNFKFEDQKVCTFENVVAALRGMANIVKATDEDPMKCRDQFNNEVSLFEQFGDMSNVEAIANADPRIKAKPQELKAHADLSKADELQKRFIKATKESEEQVFSTFVCKEIE